MLQKLALRALHALPKNAISRAVGRLARIPLPGPVQAAVNEGFARAAGIDRAEAERPPAAYSTLNDLFTRRLDSSARTVESSRDAAVAPVDGTLSTFGDIEAGTLLQAKGSSYRVRDLLDSEEHARRFRDGSYATFYLSPREYHRIHSPVTGAIESISYIPGELFPVFPFAVEHIDELFAVNERLVSSIDAGRRGRVAVVKVGATCVGRISLTFHELETNRTYRRRCVEQLEAPVRVANGDELGVFHLGSTVIVLIEAESFEFEPELETGRGVEMGERFGAWVL